MIADGKYLPRQIEWHVQKVKNEFISSPAAGKFERITNLDAVSTEKSEETEIGVFRWVFFRGVVGYILQLRYVAYMPAPAHKTYVYND
jgi:hypothetical protein